MQTFIDAFERVPCFIYKDSKDASQQIADSIAAKIEAHRKEGKPFVLGLATGASPEGVYAHLVKLHKEGRVSFAHVVVFNLDEYFPLAQSDTNSYYYFLHYHLLNHIDIKKENIFLHQGNVKKEDLKSYCLAFEQKIQDAGGVDLQILGVGRNGHIGFNEPGSSYFSKTRLISLSESSRIANSIYFNSHLEVPRLAITMGIHTIMQAKEIILLAWGESKAKVIQQAVEKQPTDQVPASLLQQHDNTTFYLDEGAASELTRNKKPWLTGSVEWSDEIIKKAVIDMALDLGKPILSLTYDDYVQYGLMDCFVDTGKSYFDINLQVFHTIRYSITGWPGGKPTITDKDIRHPERYAPAQKRVILFSPHPDDDIISMGGTMQRLHDQKHEVHVAYQVSGNIAVNDSFVQRMMCFVQEYEKDIQKTSSIAQQNTIAIVDKLRSSNRTETDNALIRSIKGLIRRNEAAATCSHVGIKPEHIHFLNLPFYETGKVEKKEPGDEDVKITKQLLNAVKPHQIFAAGDWNDPHGTHKKCFDIILKALLELRKEKAVWLTDCWVWLYKGAWEEWSIDLIEMAVPMSPEQVLSKRYGIMLHQSQKDSIPFPGTDKREFWERAEERTSHTASLYAKLGLPQYAAIEGFKRYHY